MNARQNGLRRKLVKRLDINAVFTGRQFVTLCLRKIRFAPAEVQNTTQRFATADTLQGIVKRLINLDTNLTGNLPPGMKMQMCGVGNDAVQIKNYGLRIHSPSVVAVPAADKIKSLNAKVASPFTVTYRS